MGTEIENLQALLQKDPSNFQARRELSILLANDGFNEEALSNLEYLAKFFPDDAELFYNIGILYEKTQKLVKAQLAQMKGNKVALLAGILSLRKITCHPQWTNEEIKDSVKFERVRQIVAEAVENKRKTIVFSNWSTPIEWLKQELAIYNPAVITGDTKDRMYEVDKFQNNDNCFVILGTIGAMGTGLTLNKASNVIFLDEPWNRALKDQATDRAHRIGTKYNVNVYTLICKNTIDEMVHGVVNKKGRIADEIVDGVTTEELENMLENM